MRAPPPEHVNNTAYYELMGLEGNCTEDEIKKAYKRKALKWHPDKNPENKTFAESMFKKVSDAYQVLSDPQKRALYDKYGEQALSGEGGVAEESEEGGAAGFSGFRSADDLFQTFFGARGASVFGSGASVFEVDTEGSGGGAGNVFSFVVGDEDEDDDEGEQEADEEEWEEDPAGSGARKGNYDGRRKGRRGGWRGARTWRGNRGGWQGHGRVGAGSGVRDGRGGQRGNRGGRSGNWAWGRIRGGKKVPDASIPKGSPTRVRV